MRRLINLSISITILITSLFSQDVTIWVQHEDSNWSNPYLDVYMSNTEGVYGFQFQFIIDELVGSSNFNDIIFGNASGGSAEDAGFVISTTNDGIILGFSFAAEFIPPGEGLLTSIEWNGPDLDLSGPVYLDITNIAGEGGAALTYENLSAYTPELVSINPDNGGLSETLSVSISGNDTHFQIWSGTNTFVDNINAAYLIQNSTQIDLTNLSINSLTNLEAELTIPDYVPSGLWDVAVEQGNDYGVLTLASGFTIYDEVYGCTDPEAINYNPDATIDDGSCEYNEDDIISVIPDNVFQGDNLSVSITGQDTHFQITNGTDTFDNVIDV
ncbi:MAG: hypothetical protein HOF35_04700, partial [Bacteroidetes bacterium]|nr:hypothetical protein [Bacteroidota bacterium]MBT5530823.1 hypothetical protein [Cytophagia bacterium]